MKYFSERGVNALLCLGVCKLHGQRSEMDPRYSVKIMEKNRREIVLYWSIPDEITEFANDLQDLLVIIKLNIGYILG